jgi:hypothetical protein
MARWMSGRVVEEMQVGVDEEKSPVTIELTTVAWSTVTTWKPDNIHSTIS